MQFTYYFKFPTGILHLVIQIFNKNTAVTNISNMLINAQTQNYDIYYECGLDNLNLLT